MDVETEFYENCNFCTVHLNDGLWLSKKMCTGWYFVLDPLKLFLKTGLTLPVPIPDEEKKLSEIFIFTLLCGVLKGFMKAKPFEAPQRSVKIKI